MVSLYLRVLEGGRQKLILANTRKQASKGIYYLRFSVKERQPDGTLKEKRVLESVGTDLGGAILRRNRKEEEMQECDYTIESEAPVKAKPTLAELREQFLEQKRLTKKQDGTRLDAETISAYEQETEDFLNIAKKIYPAQVKGNDLRRWMNVLEERGKSHRTICNKYTTIASFLKHCGVDHKTLLPVNERPKPDDGRPVAYKQEHVAQVLGAMDRRDYYAFLFFTETGCRMQEVMFCEWDNLDWDTGVVAIHGKKELTINGKKHQFRTKTGKGREVTVSGELLEELKEWRKQNPHALMFPTASGEPNWKFLQALKRAAYRAGLNCGKCDNCLANNPECHMWKVKSFRSTNATWNLRSKVYDVVTISEQLGHQDTDVTMRYLRSEDAGEAQKRKAQVFAGLREKLAMAATS